MTRLDAWIASHRKRDLDSRVHGVSVGAAGMVRPKIDLDGTMEVVYCLSCGNEGGRVTVELPPGVIYICDECHARSGPLPLEAAHFPEPI